MKRQVSTAKTTTMPLASVETDPVASPVPAAKNAAGGGAGTLANMRQRALSGGGKPNNDSITTSAANNKKDDGVMVNGRYSRQKGVARSKSGVLVYDIGPTTPPKRGGKRPSRNKD
jgi:hypothetical protein